MHEVARGKADGNRRDSGPRYAANKAAYRVARRIRLYYRRVHPCAPCHAHIGQPQKIGTFFYIYI